MCCKRVCVCKSVCVSDKDGKEVCVATLCVCVWRGGGRVFLCVCESDKD